MFNLSLTDLMDYTEWERQKRHEWMRQQSDQILKVSAGANGDRFETVGDLVKHIFSAEKRYVERLSGKPMTDTASLPNDNLEALFQFGRESRNSLKEFVEIFPPDRSYKRKCQETYLSVGSVPTLFCFGIQPNRLNMHARSTSGLHQEAVASFRSMNR